MTTAGYYSGLSGIQLPVPKYRLPPEWQHMSRLVYYASIFNSIEINSSFYKIPQARTVARWANDVNTSFRFTFKLFKEITHSKDLIYRHELLDDFFTAIDHVGSKKGCILVQFPPGFTVNGFPALDRLAGQLKNHNTDQAWNICLEFRHSSWYEDHLYSLLEEHNLHLVRHDMPSSATPFSTPATSVIYQRFHGPTGNYRGDYEKSFLTEYAQYVKQWLQNGKEVFIAFNNTAGNAFNNLITFNQAINEEKTF